MKRLCGLRLDMIDVRCWAVTVSTVAWREQFWSPKSAVLPDPIDGQVRRTQGGVPRVGHACSTDMCLNIAPRKTKARPFPDILRTEVWCQLPTCRHAPHLSMHVMTALVILALFGLQQNTGRFSRLRVHAQAPHLWETCIHSHF